jgi:hypothetical protein
VDLMDPNPSLAPADRAERRCTPRFECVGEVDVHRIPSTGSRHCNLRNLSESGCYIETPQPFACPATWKSSSTLET